MAGVVSNSSPLILLSFINRLDVLEGLFQAIHITPQVHDEVVVRGQGRPGSSEVSNASFILVKKVSDPLLIPRITENFRLGSGESSAIALAREMSANLVLLDDRQARIAAQKLGLTVSGTVRILEMAHEKSFIPNLRNAYLDLVHTPARISPKVLNASLSRYGFTPLD